MSDLLLLDLGVLIFGVISLLRAVRFLGHPPLRHRMLDIGAVICLLIIYPGQRFANTSHAYDNTMEMLFVLPMVLLLITGCLMLVYAMISAYLGLAKPK